MTSSKLKNNPIQVNSPTSDQSTDPTCFLHSSARIILKIMRIVMPDYLEFSYTENTHCDKYYNQQKFVDIIDVEYITSEKCGTVQYNNLILFMFVYFTMYKDPVFQNSISKNPDATLKPQWTVLENFNNTFLSAKTLPVIDCTLFNRYNNQTEYCSYIQHLFEIYYSRKNTLGYSKLIHYRYDWVLNFETYFNFLNFIKIAIDHKLYLKVSYFIGSENSEYLHQFKTQCVKGSETETFDYNQYIDKPHNTDKPLIQSNMGHAMTIIGYKNTDDIRNPFIIIKNSWNQSWCNNGVFSIKYSDLIQRRNLNIQFLLPELDDDYDENVELNIFKDLPNEYQDINDILNNIQYNIANDRIQSNAFNRSIQHNLELINILRNDIIKYKKQKPPTLNLLSDEFLEGIILFLQLENYDNTNIILQNEKHLIILKRLYNSAKPLALRLQQLYDSSNKLLNVLDKSYTVSHKLHSNELIMEKVKLKKMKLQVNLQIDEIDRILIEIQKYNNPKSLEIFQIIKDKLFELHEVNKLLLKLNIEIKNKTIILNSKKEIISTNEKEITETQLEIEKLQSKYKTGIDSSKKMDIEKDIQSKETVIIGLTDEIQFFTNKIISDEAILNDIINEETKLKVKQQSLQTEIDKLQKTVKQIKTNLPLKVSSIKFRSKLNPSLPKSKSRPKSLPTQSKLKQTVKLLFNKFKQQSDSINPKTRSKSKSRLKSKSKSKYRPKSI
jgi:hypothetical protein